MLLKVLLLFVYLFHGQIANQIENRYLKSFIRLKDHYRCRSTYNYPGSNVKRAQVLHKEVRWKVKPKKPYNPPEYTADEVKKGPSSWADPDIHDSTWVTKRPKWNRWDGYLDRQCGAHTYEVKDSYPLNPIGRTGLRGRGVLGRWGPNHSAHLVVARWLKDANNASRINKQTNKTMFELVVVQQDEGPDLEHPFKPWSVPGCFKTQDRNYTETVVKCFVEQAFNNFANDPGSRASNTERFRNFVGGAPTIYRGYVDDPRNTDNAWISTVVFLCIDETEDFMRSFPLTPGKGILKAKWTEAGSLLYKVLYGNHKDFITAASDYLNASFLHPYLDSYELNAPDSSLDKFANESVADPANYDFKDSHSSQITSAGLTEASSSLSVLSMKSSKSNSVTSGSTDSSSILSSEILS